jgi:hypothetical protein
MTPSIKTVGDGTGLGAAIVVLVALLAGCSSSTQTAAEQAATAATASPTPTTASTPPIQDPDAPSLEPVSTTSTDGTVEADGEGCARMGQGRAAYFAGDDRPDPHALPAEATDHLRRVFAASTDVSTATAYREDGGDSIFFCTGYTLREDSSGAMSAVIPVPTTSAIATVAGAGSGYSPGENVVDYYGYASDEVAHVIVTTPDNRQHLAAINGHVWWAAPVVDEATAAHSQEGTWQALDHTGAVLAEGETRPA